MARTQREKLTAVMAADMVGVANASKATGIPQRTIYEWRNDPAMAEFRDKTRDALAEDILTAAALAWDLLIKRIRAGDIASRDLVLAAGVAVDKAQLLSGMATARTESRDLTGTIADAELASAIREAETLLRRAPEEAPEPAEG